MWPSSRAAWTARTYSCASDRSVATALTSICKFSLAHVILRGDFRLPDARLPVLFDIFAQIYYNDWVLKKTSLMCTFPLFQRIQWICVWCLLSPSSERNDSQNLPRNKQHDRWCWYVHKYTHARTHIAARARKHLLFASAIYLRHSTGDVVTETHHVDEPPHTTTFAFNRSLSPSSAVRFATSVKLHSQLINPLARGVMARLLGTLLLLAVCVVVPTLGGWFNRNVTSVTIVRPVVVYHQQAPSYHPPSYQQFVVS